MSEIKRIFHERHRECAITRRPEYSLAKIITSTVYAVDCIFGLPPGKIGRRCDEFVIYDLSIKKAGFYLVERKDNHSNDVNKVKEQLQGGAHYIEDFLKKDPATDGQPFSFMPVWVSKGIRQSMIPALKQIKISLHGINKPIHHIKAKGVLPKLT